MTDTNQWAPSADELNTWTPDTYGDDPTATPMSEQPGQDDAGTTADVRKNLLTDVRERAAIPQPPVEVRHYVETIEQETDFVRTRTIVLTGTTTPVTILEENPLRKRALIKVLYPGAQAAIAITASRVGGRPGYTAAAGPFGQSSAYILQATDAPLQVKSKAALDAYAVVVNETDQVTVTIWEESYGPGNVTGLT